MNQIAAFLVSLRIVPIIAAPLAAIVILLSERVAIKVLALAFQYAMVAWLVASALPLESVAAKLVAGWITAFIFYWGSARTDPQKLVDANVGVPRGRVFRVIAVLLVVVGTLGISFDTWMPIETLGSNVQISAMVLFVLGLLGIGLYNNPFHIGISLVTMLSGFEVIYSALEPSLAMVALLALVHLGIALLSSYFGMDHAESDRGVRTQS